MLKAAEFEESVAVGFGWLHAGTEVVGSVHVDVAGKFGVEIAIETIAAEKVAKANERGAKRCHDARSLELRKRARMAVVCSHSRVSFSSCLRPVRVSL